MKMTVTQEQKQTLSIRGAAPYAVTTYTAAIEGFENAAMTFQCIGKNGDILENFETGHRKIENGDILATICAMIEFKIISRISELSAEIEQA